MRDKNDWRRIIALLKPLAREMPEDVYVLSSLGFAYSQLNRFTEARYCYNQWLEKASHKAVPYYCLGYLEYYQKNWTAAIEWFDLALEENPQYLVCLYRKGVALYNKFKPKQANEILVKAVKTYADNSNTEYRKRNAKYYYKAIFYLGKTYHQTGQKNNALACFSKLLDEDKRDYVDVLFKKFNLAKALYEIGKSIDALDILKKLPPKEFVFDLIAQIYRALDEMNLAHDNFNKALKIRPCSYVFMHRAELFEQVGDWNAAARDYHDALKRDRLAKHKILYALGKIALKQNEIINAQNYFTRANAFKNKVYGKDYLEAHLGLAECYTLLNQKEKAQQEYRLAASLKNQWREYYFDYHEYDREGEI